MLFVTEQHTVGILYPHHCREIAVALTRLSLSLGNNYQMKESEFLAIMKSLGLECREGYYEEFMHVIIQKINVTFTIGTFENFVAARSILIHLGHFPFATHCSKCRLQRRIYLVCCTSIFMTYVSC